MDRGRTGRTRTSRAPARSLAALVTALGALATALAAAPPAAAAPAGPAEEEAVLTVTGHGWGHGRGLSQWGALGYAVDAGWDHRRILAHYYGGTTEGATDGGEVSVRLTGLDGADEVVLASEQPVVVEGEALPAGSGAVLRRDGDRWSLAVRPGGCTGPDEPGARDVGPAPAVWLPADPGDDAGAMLTVCATERPYRGSLQPVVDDDGVSRLVNHVPLEAYLRGVVPRESPASWADLGDGAGAAALRAQAVAARSYARAEDRYAYADSCDTTACQVYGGAADEDPRTDRAVEDTAGQVRLSGDGSVARTEFSSSSGGWTAGGEFPAVEDDGDARSPRHDWVLEVPVARVQAAWPQVGAYRSMEVLERNGLGADGGRATSVRIAGDAGEVTATGDEVRRALGLWSDWFTPAP